MNLGIFHSELVQRLISRVPSPRRRIMLLVVPIHIVAFTLLFFGIMRVVVIEILNAHGLDARHLLEEAVEDLHPLMVSNEEEEIPGAIAEYAHDHKLLDLRVYRTNGTEVGSLNPVDPEVAEFIVGSEDELFRFERDGQNVTMHGMRRVMSDAECAECHIPAATLGVATLRLDLSEQMVSAHGSVRRNLAMLIAGWALLVGVVNLWLGSMTRRSMARLELGEGSRQPGARQSEEAPGLLLDPVSTELYQSLRSFREYQQNLDAEVTSRLRRAEHMASLGQLAAGLAHEIKNPLAGIRGVIELLRDETEDESQRNLFEQIVTELDRVNRTIHSLLSFARPSLPNRVCTDVRGLIEDSVRLVRPKLQKQNISLEIEIGQDVNEFELDPTHMRHVLMNLVTNSADAIEDDGNISVRAIASPDGDDLFLSVTDDGPGIDADIHEKIFEPFYTTKFTGTGLGLAVVNSLVSRSDGVVELLSKPGCGTTVFVLLPGGVTEHHPASFATKG